MVGSAGASAVAAPTVSVTRHAGQADPALNDTPVVAYASLCYSSRTAATGAACQRALVTDINAARAREGVRALVLPRGYAQLPAALQVFVVTNLERVDRGLSPIAGTNATLNSRARVGAVAGVDPTIGAWDLGRERGQVWTSVQAAVSNPLEADWLWMYSDGWGGTHTTNSDCTGPRGTGCWGHRHNILNSYSGSTVLVAGTAAATPAGAFVSYAQLVLAGTGSAPTLLYTWKQALAAGADRH